MKATHILLVVWLVAACDPSPPERTVATATGETHGHAPPTLPPRAAGSSGVLSLPARNQRDTCKSSAKAITLEMAEGLPGLAGWLGSGGDKEDLTAVPPGLDAKRSALPAAAEFAGEWVFDVVRTNLALPESAPRSWQLPARGAELDWLMTSAVVIGGQPLPTPKVAATLTMGAAEDQQVRIGISGLGFSGNDAPSNALARQAEAVFASQTPSLVMRIDAWGNSPFARWSVPRPGQRELANQLGDLVQTTWGMWPRGKPASAWSTARVVQRDGTTWLRVGRSTVVMAPTPRRISLVQTFVERPVSRQQRSADGSMTLQPVSGVAWGQSHGEFRVSPKGVELGRVSTTYIRHERMVVAAQPFEGSRAVAPKTEQTVQSTILMALADRSKNPEPKIP